MGIIFTGIFFQENVFDCLRDKIPVHQEDIKNRYGGYHVTCCYKPTNNQLFSKNMVDSEVEVEVTHIMRGDGVTAVAVNLPKELKEFYYSESVPHITLGIDFPHKPVESGSISLEKWEKIDPFIVRGRVGYLKTRKE